MKDDIDPPINMGAIMIALKINTIYSALIAGIPSCIKKD